MKLAKEEWEELRKVIQQEIHACLKELAKEGKISVTVEKTIIQRDKDAGSSCVY